MGKARDKLPTWFSTRNIYYPGRRNLEQSSGEIAATYKASQIKAAKAWDITGGFGVDSYFISKKVRSLEYWEAYRELVAIARHNFKQLGASNIACHVGDGLEGLKNAGEMADLIYIDPSRRTGDNKRVFLLSDCIPDIPSHMATLFMYSPLLLVKTSPLLDLTAGMAELRHIKEIHVVAVKNEVKELLWMMEKEFTGATTVKTINFASSGDQKFEFPFYSEKMMEENISEPRGYIFEPNAAIMKSGGFNCLSTQYQVGKLHRHTHIYTADRLIDFPGRRFRVENIFPYSRKSLQQLPFKTANISARNFPDSVKRIRQKTGIGDGGPVYLFFTRSEASGLIMIECKKI
jgi:hypothetical protein